MESTLSGIPGVVIYIDDVIVTGKSEEEHLSVLEEVLCRIMESGLRLRKGKCVFLALSLVHLGHQIDSEESCCRKSKQCRKHHLQRTSQS